MLRDVSPILFALALTACSPGEPASDVPAPRADERPSILLVTLDTTRADRLGSTVVETPRWDALAARGVVFTQAYATAPMTLPSHTSMMTGLYPAGHGIRENARTLPTEHPLLAELLKEKGYRTAAFVSGLPLSRQFGIARGFDHYDDHLGDAAERRAKDTTDLALAELERSTAPLFLWVHFFDPHEPYDPPAPFKERYPDDPYAAEIAAMDHELGRLVDAFEARFGGGPWKVLVAGDHGEGLGEHGERLHGNLLYQGVMRVPMLVAGSGVSPGRRDEPVSTRRVFDTVSRWAGDETSHDLLEGPPEVVMAEAMKPFLQYGWQPQVMAIHGRLKVIRSAELEVYDVVADPGETNDLASTAELGGELREALRSYPFVPAPSAGVPNLSEEDKKRLASLGYVDGPGSSGRLRDGAPSPKDMSHLFADLDHGSALFVDGDYERAIAVFEDVQEADPTNLMVTLRLAVAHSVLGHEERAAELFERARTIGPESPDVDHYRALHLFRNGRWGEAEPLLAAVLERTPDRLPALEAMARIAEAQGRTAEARRFLERVVGLKSEPVDELLRLGDLAMTEGLTDVALRAFEDARALRPAAYPRFLELGVCYLVTHRYAEAADALDQVPPEHPGYAMALFKRAQASVLLGEPDQTERVRLAWQNADPVTRPLIEGERLFRGIAYR